MDYNATPLAHATYLVSVKFNTRKMRYTQNIVTLNNSDLKVTVYSREIEPRK